MRGLGSSYNFCLSAVSIVVEFRITSKNKIKKKVLKQNKNAQFLFCLL